MMIAVVAAGFAVVGSGSHVSSAVAVAVFAAVPFAVAVLLSFAADVSFFPQASLSFLSPPSSFG